MKDEKKTQVSQRDVRALNVTKKELEFEKLCKEGRLVEAIDLASSSVSEAMRFNDGKVEWSLVDFKSIEPMVRVLEYGSKKYSKDNWKQGMDVTKMMESLLRHSFSFLSGETEDPESGISHIGHIMCNAMFIQWMLENKPERDDRV